MKYIRQFENDMVDYIKMNISNLNKDDLVNKFKQSELLIYSITTNQTERAKEIISSKIAFLDYQDDQGLTPLICAALHNNYTIVRELIKAGADPDIIRIFKSANLKGGSAITYAARNSNIRMVLYLIKHNADLTIYDHNKQLFIELLNDKQKLEIKNKYPIKYEDLLIYMEGENYNL